MSNNNITVYFDNRFIEFVHPKTDENNGAHMLLTKKPEWQDVTAFLHSSEKKLVYESLQPELNFRHFMTFFIPVEAAGGLVVNRSGQFLFIFRNGRWDLPKGVIESNEQGEQAAIREVQEECGITTVQIIQKLPISYHIYPDKKTDWILKKTHWYLMMTSSNTLPVPQTTEGITKVEWRDPDNIDDIIENTYGNIRNLLGLAINQSFNK